MLTQANRLTPAVRAARGIFHTLILVLGRNGRNKAFAAFCTATVEDFTTLSGCHSGSEAMGMSSFDFARLECTFHRVISLNVVITTAAGKFWIFVSMCTKTRAF
jgi:hypothetical protein